jgi:glycerol-3-phosphate acyltransferase PlsX
MGGDHAPKEIVAGAVRAAAQIDGEILLVGSSDAIAASHVGSLPANVRVIEASQTIDMHDSPVDALRRKKDSSLVIAANLVRDGEADAMISAGNTGAAAAAATMLWKTLPGISRPAIATVFPSRTGHFVVLDSGATVDADPRNMLEFAVMGSAYAETVLQIAEPKVALLNIGEEASKGNSLTKSSYKLLHDNLPNFVGNVEGKDMWKGGYDVVVCEAFVGNVVLKASEGLGEFLFDLIREGLTKNPITKVVAGLFLKSTFRDIRRRTDYSEYGGAPLLGVNGLCVICHGRSNAKAIANAILVVKREHQEHLNDRIEAQVDHLRKEPSDVA